MYVQNLLEGRFTLQNESVIKDDEVINYQNPYDIPDISLSS